VGDQVTLARSGMARFGPAIPMDEAKSGHYDRDARHKRTTRHRFFERLWLRMTA